MFLTIMLTTTKTPCAVRFPIFGCPRSTVFTTNAKLPSWTSSLSDAAGATPLTGRSDGLRQPLSMAARTRAPAAAAPGLDTSGQVVGWQLFEHGPQHPNRVLR